MIIQRILNNKNFRNGALFALFSFFNTGINFVIMMVMARFIKPDSYGQLSLFTTMVSLLSIFICLNTNGFIGVNFFSSSKEKIQRLLNVVVLTTLLTYMVMLTAMCCFTSALEEVSGLSIVYEFFSFSFCASDRLVADISITGESNITAVSIAVVTFLRIFILFSSPFIYS